MTKEHRRSPRKQIDLMVQIQTDDGSLMTCLMSNISQTGVCLTTSRAGVLPAEFMLFLKDDLKRWCQIQWRTKTQVGVKFTPIPLSKISQPQNVPHIRSPLDGDPTREVQLHHILLPAKKGNEFHRRPGDRWITVLEGELVFTIKGGEIRTLKFGDSLYIPRGTIHRNQNVSDRLARAVEFMILDKDKPQIEIV